MGAFTSAAGHGVYTARSWPKEYWNRRAFVTEPTVQLVAEMILEEDGSGYSADYPRNLIASDDEWFSPIQAEVGPDGQVWIADWYNYILQHNAESDRQEPTPGNAYANPLRDRQHGRIYRIVHEDNEQADVLNLANAGSDELVETLTHNNMGWRKHAQRLLVERGETDIVSELINLIEDESTDETGLNAGAIHAMWTLHGLGQLAGSNDDALDAVVEALDHISSGVRLNAVQVLPSTSASVTSIINAGLLSDDDLQVRLKTLTELADMSASDRAGDEIFQMLRETENLDDRWIREAAAISATTHSSGFLGAAERAGYDVTNLEVNQEEPIGSLESIIAFVQSENPDEGSQPDGEAQSTNEAVDVDVELELGVTPNVLEYDKEELRAEAGQTVRITFTNTDNMEHNLLFILPGTLPDVGELADEMMSSPEGRDRGYVPDTPDVIASTPILDPGESYDLVFTLPDEPGEYQFVCTIPGHWRIMNGTLIVE